MNRRTFLTTTAAAATAATAVSAATVPPYGETGAPVRPTGPLPLGPLPGSRYPDSHLESMKKPKVSFGPTGFPAFAGTMAVERIATGMRWAEGPVYFPAGRYVLFSDIPNNRIMRLCEDDDHLSVYRQPSMNSNGPGSPWRAPSLSAGPCAMPRNQSVFMSRCCSECFRWYPNYMAMIDNYWCNSLGFALTRGWARQELQWATCKTFC